MNLFKLHNRFVQIAKYISPNCKMFLSKLRNVFEVFCFDVPGVWQICLACILAILGRGGREATLCCEPQLAAFSSACLPENNSFPWSNILHLSPPPVSLCIFEFQRHVFFIWVCRKHFPMRWRNKTNREVKMVIRGGVKINRKGNGKALTTT